MSIWDDAEDLEINGVTRQITMYGEAAIAVLTWGLITIQRLMGRS